MSFLFPDRDAPQDDDPFASTRMSFGDHIEDLRSHMLRAIYGFLVALIAGFAVAREVTHFIVAPVEAELMKIHERRLQEAEERFNKGDKDLNDLNEVREKKEKIYLPDLGLKPPPGGSEWATVRMRYHPVQSSFDNLRIEQKIRPPTLKSFTVMETFIVWMKVAVYVAIVLASPWIFIQLWSFIAAGLYPHEKRLVNYYLPGSIALFLIGVVFCQFVVMPRALDYLLSFNEWIGGLEPELRLSDWLSFALMMPIMFGLSFQTPLIMYFLYRMGFVDWQTYVKRRRLAWFGLALVAVILTASPDAVSYLAMTIPLWGLYELGIILCRVLKRPEFESDETELEELVEV
jgi:sec-independent protein translocase protein TatC